MARTILFLYSSGYDAEKVPEFLMPGNEAENDQEPGSDKSQSPDSSTFKRLNNNVLVYKCADMLGIENLKVLAADRFLDDARIAFADPRFSLPLCVMYESTQEDDEHLRVPVTSLCVKNHEMLANIPEVVSVLEKHEHGVWKVYMPLLKNNADGEFLRRKWAKNILTINGYIANRRCNCRKPCSYREPYRFVVRDGDDVVVQTMSEGWAGSWEDAAEPATLQDF